MAPDGWTVAEKIVEGDRLLTDQQQSVRVVSVTPSKKATAVFDPIDVDGGSAYCSESLVSHNCSFLSSSYTLIKSDVLTNMKSAIPLMTTEDGYHEYYEPQQGRVYVTCVDTASGQGLDASTFVTFDVTEMPYRTVATYSNNRISTMEFPRVIMTHAERYHMPWMLVEVMDIGRDVAHILFREFNYPQFMSTMTEKRLGQRLIFNNRAQRHLGLRMTPGVKRSGCAVLKTLVESNQLLVHDYRMIQQLSTFVQRGSIFEAERGHHDDLVIPMVMLSWASLQPNFAEITATRALDVYLKTVKEPAKENPVQVNPRDEAPMLFGYIPDLEDELNDNSWLFH